MGGMALVTGQLLSISFKLKPAKVDEISYGKLQGQYV
jgi:hypothetical protein